MKIGIARLNWLTKANSRLDSSFHLSEGRIYRKSLEASPLGNIELGEIVDRIFYGGRAKRIYVKDDNVGIPFMGSADMLKSDFNSFKFVSRKHTKNLEESMLKEGWTLISRSGTIGNTAFVNSDFDGKAASEHIIRIVPKKNIYEGYLYAFLSSKYGYSLMTQGSFGAVIQHIEPDYLSGIPIPVFTEIKQKKIHCLIKEAAVFRSESNKFLKEAVDFFEEKYRVEDISNIFSKNINDIGFSWAAYNNNLECDKVVSKLDKSISIRDVATQCFSPPLFKHIYLDNDNGHPFLTGAELTKFTKKYYRWLSPRGVKNIEDYKVKKGTLLLYKSGTADGGILGNAFIADDILHNACLSDHVIRIFTDDIKMSYWLFAFLKSSAGVRLLRKTATGSMIPFITPERLLDINFPKPDEKFDWIADMIEKYLAKSVQSQLNEIEAINIIENEIESWQA